MKRIKPPLRGMLGAPSTLPEWLTIQGHIFRRAIWQKAYPGVVLQYREHVARNSLHLFVHSDGSYTINHADSYNPDLGAPLLHFLFDVILAVPND